MSDRDVRVNLTLAAKGDAPKALRDCAAAADTASKYTSAFERDLKRLDGGRAASVGKSMADIAREAERATQSTRALNAETARMRGGSTGIGMGGPAPRAGFEQAGGSAQPPGLAQQFGVNPGAVQAAGQAFAAITAVAKGLSAVAKGVDAFTDETLTANQAMRKFASELPVVGEAFAAIGSLADSISGKAKELRKIARDDIKATAKSQAELSASQSQAPFLQSIAAIDARSKALAAGGLSQRIDYSSPTRDTLKGETEFAQFERKVPLLEDERRAKMEAAAAADMQKKASSDSKALSYELAIKTDERERAQAEAKAVVDSRPKTTEAQASEPGRGGFAAGFGIGANMPNWMKVASSLNPATFGTVEASFESTDKIKAGGQAKGLLQEEIKLRQQLAAAQQQEGAAIKASAEAQSKYRQTGIALLKDEMQVLKEKEQMVSGGLTSFGGLDASQRFSASQAANQFKERGFESLTADQRAAISAAGGGQALAFAQKQSAMNDPAFKQFFADLGMDSDLGDVRKRQTELSAKISTSLEFDETELAKQMKDALKPVLEEIVKSFKEIAAATLTQVELNQDYANASQ